MDLILKRNSFGVSGIFGQLTNVDKNLIVAATLEHSFWNAAKRSYMPAVPVGTYTCKRRHSPHFGYDLFEITNVPGHSFIEIHVGNVNDNTEGCVLLGRSRQGYSLLESRVAFAAFMKLQEGLDTFQLVVQ
jgi:hypothetical protein